MVAERTTERMRQLLHLLENTASLAGQRERHLCLHDRVVHSF